MVATTKRLPYAPEGRKGEWIFKTIQEMAQEHPNLTRTQLFEQLAQQTGASVATISSNYYRSRRLVPPSVPDGSLGEDLDVILMQLDDAVNQLHKIREKYADLGPALELAQRLRTMLS